MPPKRRRGRAVAEVADLFDAAFYLAANPDVAAASIEPLRHYLEFGWREGRKPNPVFDPGFYLAQNPDVAAAGAEPLAHYAGLGAAEGRNPSAGFETEYYLRAHPEVAASGLHPLLHYLRIGRAAGLSPYDAPVPPNGSWVPPRDLITFVAPLKISISPGLAERPHLNVLAPGLAMRHMSGGPSTIVGIAYRLALRGIPVRLVSAAFPLDPDQDALLHHARALAGGDPRPVELSLADWHDRAAPCVIGENDVFMATAWWTAQLAKYAIRHTRQRKFVYLIQDYEPLLHPASSQAALAEETYALPHLGVINSSLVYDYLVSRQIGRYAEPQTAGEAIVFEPAVDATLFRPPLKRSPRRKQRRLLFYARPSYAERNLYELGVASLQKAIFDRVFDVAAWEFCGIGEAFTTVELGRGAVLEYQPWCDLEAYAEQMRGADLLLSLMMSPHPSYPPLEMARCGGLVVTTSFANKTATRLAAISENIIAVPATIEAIADGLGVAVIRLAGGKRRSAHFGMPQTWDDALEGPVERLDKAIRAMFRNPGT